MKDVSISIISYNTHDLLEKCLKSIYKYTKGVTFEIIVVDNASTDGSADMVANKFKDVKLIRNKKNNFFAGANNQAFKIANSKYFLILNSDTFFVDNSIKKIVDYMDKNKKVGAVEGLEMYENGKFMNTGSNLSTPLIDFYELSFVGKRFKNQKTVDKYRIAKLKRDKTFPVEVGCDAFLCVRTNLMRKIKGYDTNFLLYYTENDLCLRIKNEGYDIMHLGDVKVMHRVSSSAKQLGWKKLDIYYSDLRKYYSKHGYKMSGNLLFTLLKCEEFALKVFRPQTV